MAVKQVRYSFFLILWLAVNSASAQDVHVAVASNFIAPMKAIIASFEARNSHQVVMSSGSSGKLYAQIRHGAPFHLMFSADQEKPYRLDEEGFTVAGSRFTYAIGKLALIAARPDTISSQMPLQQLIQQPGINKIALANPRLAPYGVAAEAVLGKLEIKAATRSKWVVGENIAQTYQFVSTGNADIGFVALSQVLSDNHHHSGPYLRIPDDLYADIRQDAVLLKSGADNKAVEVFLRFVQSETAKGIIESFGYDVPP